MTQLELPLGPPAKPAPPGYTVFVDDNWHFMDEEERYKFGVFATAEEAIAACRRIVDEDLVRAFKPGMTADALFDWYVMAGNDPFVVPGVGFSAWDFAEWRCSELAGPADPTYSPISFEEFLRRRAAEAPGGHKLYEARREAPEEAKPALMEREKEFWKGVHSRLDPAWRAVLEETPVKTLKKDTGGGGYDYDFDD